MRASEANLDYVKCGLEKRGFALFHHLESHLQTPRFRLSFQLEHGRLADLFDQVGKPGETDLRIPERIRVHGRLWREGRYRESPCFKRTIN